MKIEIEVNNTYCKILTNLDINQLSVIQDTCSFEVEGSSFKVAQYRRKGIRWDGTRKLFNIQTRRFPIGLLNRVVELMRNCGVEVQLLNNRTYCMDKISYNICNFEERDYQSRAVIASITNGNGIIKAATGAGKTTIAARTIDALGKRSVFIVHTKDLLYQTKESFQKMFPDEKIGQIGDGVIDYQNITVATMQSLASLHNIDYESYKYDEDGGKYEEKIVVDKEKVKNFNNYRNTVGVIMFDEVQRVCSNMAATARFLFENANYAFGYSASPWRDDGSDLMIEAAFGSRIVDITATELIRRGYLVQPNIQIIRRDCCIWEGTTYEKIYKTGIVENVMRNLQVVNEAIKQYDLGRNTLVLVTQIKHGQILEEMFKAHDKQAVFISGKSDMKKRKQVVEDMRAGKAPIVIATTIADVGLDVPRLQSIVEAGAGKSSVTALQRLGRIMRPFEGKDKCYFITFWDNIPYINNQIKNKVAIWRTEPDFIIEGYDTI